MSLIVACIVAATGCGGSIRSAPFAASSAGQLAAPVSYLYVADNANRQFAQVDVLLRNDFSKGIVDRYKSRLMQYPAGIFVDAAGQLYVPNANDSGHDTVYAYGTDEHHPIRVYRGIACAGDVVVGVEGTVYVADPCGTNNHGTVHIFAPGHTMPTRDLHPGCAPASLTLDDENNLYVSCVLPRSYWSQVKRFAPHSSEGVNLLPRHEVFFAGRIALDSHGNLLVRDFGRGAIDVFSAENQPPARVIKTGQTEPGSFTLDPQENKLYVTAEYLPDVRRAGRSGFERPNTLVVLDYASGKRLHTLRRLVKGWLPAGVAVYPPAPFGARF